MADPASLSLDDYWKAQKKSGKGSFGRGRGGGGGGGGRRGPKPNAAYGGGTGSAGPSGNRGNPNSFRGRKGRQGSNNVQRRRGNRGIGNNRNFTGGIVTSNQSRGSFQRSGGGGQGQGGQGQNRRQRMRNRNRNPNPNRQVNSRRQRNSGGVVNQGFSNQQRYFSNASAIVSTAGRPPRNQAPKRLRQKKVVGLGNPRAGLNLRAAAATRRAVLQLTQKRVQRAKLIVSKKRNARVGGPKKLMSGTVGRVALGKNGFFTVRNTKSKQLERTLVKMKIARAQNARNRGSPPQQRNANVNIPGSSGMRSRSINRSFRATNTSAPPHPIDWNTSIVRTMRNDLADEMTTSQLNPEIQRKIAFIQSRSKDRAPVLQDFKAPVTTSRMKLSDRFRLLRDQ